MLRDPAKHLKHLVELQTAAKKSDGSEADPEEMDLPPIGEIEEMDLPPIGDIEELDKPGSNK